MSFYNGDIPLSKYLNMLLYSVATDMQFCIIDHLLTLISLQRYFMSVEKNRIVHLDEVRSITESDAYIDNTYR